MDPEHFVGRTAQARTILANTERRHCTLLVGAPGIGKSALIHYLEPVLETMGVYLPTSRVGPGFGTFLRELFTGLWERHKIPDQTPDLHADLKAWAKTCPNNDEKAKWLLGVIEGLGTVIVAIDDAHGVTPSNRPWLERLTEAATVIAAVDERALTKAGTKRFWKRFDEVRLEPLAKAEAAELLEHLVARYRVVADEPEIYRRRVLDLAQGNPFELERLVKHHAAESLVRARELGHYGQDFAARDTKQIALAPLLLMLGAFTIAGRYIARAQGNLDLYVLSGLGVGLSIVLFPWLRGALKPRSRS